MSRQNVSYTQRLVTLLSSYPVRNSGARRLRDLSNVRAYGTGRGVFTREDFWFIVVTEGNEDETEIHARQRPCREDGP